MYDFITNLHLSHNDILSTYQAGESPFDQYQKIEPLISEITRIKDRLKYFRNNEYIHYQDGSYFQKQNDFLLMVDLFFDDITTTNHGRISTQNEIFIDSAKLEKVMQDNKEGEGSYYNLLQKIKETDGQQGQQGQLTRKKEVEQLKQETEDILKLSEDKQERINKSNQETQKYLALPEVSQNVYDKMTPEEKMKNRPTASMDREEAEAEGASWSDPRRAPKLGGKNKPKKDLKTFLSKLHKLIKEFE